jgi:DNA polymerase-1
VLDGPRTAASVASGRSKLIGLHIAQAGQAPVYYTQDFTKGLAALTGQPRLYHDAPLALAIELRHGLPNAPFDDIRAMLRLLEHPSQVLEQAETLRTPGTADTRAASLTRVLEVRRLAPQLLQRIEAEGLGYVYREIELPVAIPTAVMITAGLRFDRHTLNQIRTNQWARAERARSALRKLAGSRFNPDDAQGVYRFLYQDLALPCPQETRRLGISKTALIQLEPLHVAACLLLTYRDAKPAFDSSAAILEALGPDSIVRGDLDPLGTSSGRYSCSNPPLQVLDARVRAAVKASPGHLLLEADYSQMELRVLAHFSQDVQLLEAFARGYDLHRRTVARVLNIEEAAVTEADRQLGKKLNFGIVYGQTAFGLAEDLGISEADAQELLAAHMAAYPGVARWITQVHEQVATTGEVRTLFGRRRCLPKIFSALPADVAEARRQAVNTIIQGTAADLFKLTLIRLNQELPPEVKMLLPVHDSVLFEVPEGMIEQAEREIVAAMEITPPEFSVPLRAETGTGRTWAECKAG